MAIDITTPQSAGWYLKRLGQRLADRQHHYQMLDNYYRGDHPLPEGDERIREFYRRFQRKARTNYCGLISDATRQRIRFEGLHVGSVADQSAGDKLARAIWQANNMDAASNLVHATALNLSDSYVIVGPPPDGREFPLITAEDPTQVIVEFDPAGRESVRAGLKTWCDEGDKTRHAIVYLPGSIHYFAATRATRSFGSGNWMVEKDPEVNPRGEVPVVRFVGRPVGFDGEGLAEFEDCLDVQDRINDLILNQMVIAKMQAFRQRYVTGLNTEDEDGNEIKFYPGADLVWAVENENVKFGDFDQADLGPLLASVNDAVTQIVTLSGLPPEYIAGGLINVSADTLAATDSRQVDKCVDRMIYFGEAWERVHRLAFGWIGQGDLIGADAEVQWADPHRRSVAQLADAATKYMAAGVPWRARMRLLGFSETEIDRLDVERAEDAAEGLIQLTPSPTPMPLPAPMMPPAA